MKVRAALKSEIAIKGTFCHMALFARKNKNASNDPNGTAVANAVATLPTAPDANGTAANGASVNGASVNGDAFAAVDEDALYQKATGRKGRKGNKPARVSRGLKGGAVVGLNIGNETIKAVELRGKGLDVAVTAIGSIATPPDCLSNGVILNPVSLSSALRDLFVQSGIKSRNVITSVSGSGALVVRVLEVARMSDAELTEHMNTDLERYVPFPPNEVVKDYRPLRELPTDPDAPNMEVLLAAAQNEVIDQHLQVLKDAKIEPQAIDVEPLAAARAIFYDANNQEPNVDYNAATAVVNIGATNTEISVLRGDVLVFTRSVPVGGQALTQALCDTLGMAWPDAEQTKFEMGDALPPHSGETPTADDTDWSAFGDDTQNAEDADPFSSNFYNDGPNNEPNGSDPQVQQHQKQDGDQTPSANSESASGEKDLRLPDFDLTRFNFSEEEGEVDETIPTTPVEASDESDEVESGEGFAPKPVSVADVAAAISTMSSGRAVPASPDVIAPATTSATSSTRDDDSLLPAIGDVNPSTPNRAASAPIDEDDTSRLPGVLDFPMAGEDEGLSGMAPSGQMYGMNSAEDPDLISFPSLPAGLIAAGRESDMVYGEDTLPTMIDEDDENPSRAGEQLIDLPSMAALTDISAGQTGETPTLSAASANVAGNFADSAQSIQTPVESVFDFSDTSAPAAPIDDFESAFADMIGDAPSSVNAPATVPGASATIATPSVSPSAFAMDATLAPEQSDFDLDQFATPSGSDSFGIDDFGFGMAGGDSGALTPLKVYEVLQPRLQELVAEIRRSLEYFASRYPDAAVQRIVLVGGGARLPNMDAMLTQEIGIPTVIDRPLSRLKLQVPNLPPGFVDEQGATFAVATGLALRDLAA